eukprot:SAG31_NODE_1293_length_8955_cov_100.938911_5_plen_136_part_00
MAGNSGGHLDRMEQMASSAAPAGDDIKQRAGQTAVPPSPTSPSVSEGTRAVDVGREANAGSSRSAATVDRQRAELFAPPKAAREATANPIAGSGEAALLDSKRGFNAVARAELFSSSSGRAKKVRENHLQLPMSG